MKYLSLIILLFSFLFISCSDDENPAGNNDNKVEQVENYLFYMQNEEEGSTPNLYRLSLDGSGDETMIAEGAYLFSKPMNDKLYISVLKDENAIYKCNLDGTNKELIVEDASLGTVSHDGNLMAYIKLVEETGAIINELHVMNLDTKEDNIITATYAEKTLVTFSKDNDYLYFYAGNAEDSAPKTLFKVDLETRIMTKVVEGAMIRTDYDCPMHLDMSNGNLLFPIEAVDLDNQSYRIINEAGETVKEFVPAADKNERLWIYSINNSKVYYDLEDKDNDINRNYIENYTSNEQTLLIENVASDTQILNNWYNIPINDEKEVLYLKFTIDIDGDNRTYSWHWEKINVETKEVTVVKEYAIGNTAWFPNCPVMFVY